MTKLNKTLLFLNLAFIAAIIAVGAVLAWTGPGVNPPTGSGLFYYSGGNVGIGTANPIQKLDVNGTVQMTGFKMATGASNGYVLTSDASGNGTWAAAAGGGVVAVANGGTGLTAAPANGQILIGNGTGYVLATLTAGSGANITNGAGAVTIAAPKDTSLPRLSYAAAGAIDVAAKPGAVSSTVRLTLQDGVQRSFTGTLAWSFANGAADLGLDTGTEAGSTWYYMYAVPKSGDNSLLSVRASVAAPPTGPTGYSNWKYLGAFRNNASSNIIPFQQKDNDFDYLYLIEGVASAGLGTSFYSSKITLGFTDVVPQTAGAMKFVRRLQRSCTWGWGLHSELYVYGQSNLYGGQLVADTQECIFVQDGGTIPMLDSQKRIEYTSDKWAGTATISSQNVWTQGWIDEYL